MKAIVAALSTACTLFMTACANDGPTADEVGEKFRRGASGEGQLGPVDRSDDPYVRARGSGSGHP